MSALDLRRSESVVVDGAASWWIHFALAPLLQVKYGGTLVLTSERLLFRATAPAPREASVEVDLEAITRLGRHTFKFLPLLRWGLTVLDIHTEHQGPLRFQVFGLEEWFSQIALARIHRERALGITRGATG